MDMLTPEDIAERFKVSAKTVRSWLRSGELPAAKFGGVWRVDSRDVWNFMDRHRAEQLRERVQREFPDVDWSQGRCEECGRAIPVPASDRTMWVCGQTCRDDWFRKLYHYIDPGSEEETKTRTVRPVPYWT